MGLDNILKSSKVRPRLRVPRLRDLKFWISKILTWIIHKKWMKDENMLKKKDSDDAAVVAALRLGHWQRLYFEQIAVFRHKFMNYSG